MGYMDTWIYNSKPRIKVFLCYLLIFIAFFIFSDVMIFLYTKSLYTPMESYKISTKTPQITVSDAVSSNVNGNVKGTIKNTTGEQIKDKYLKFEFYTERGTNAGTKYIDLNYLQPDEERNYEVGFKYNNVKGVNISITDKTQDLKPTTEELEDNPIYGPAGLISGVILGYFLL